MNDYKSDDQLLVSVRSGDRSALAELYNRYERMVFGFAYRCTSDMAAAEEIVQDVFLKLWQTTVQYEVSQGKFSTWLLSITRNASIDYHRRNRRYENVNITDEVFMTVSDATPGPDELAEISDVKRAIHSALHQLPPDQRQVVEHMYFKGYTQQEIADQFSVSVGTIKSRVRLAMQKLREQLASDGMGVDNRV